MCGFASIVSEQNPVSGEAIARATKVLQHRGPDAQNHWISRDRRIALGHARLSIIDLQTGDQPLTNEDGTLHAVVNGEFYDFERIRSELETKGHRFRTRSDSEIALHLYEEFGMGCVEHLRGEFAFLLWDDRRERLIAVRDRFGIKPLFYGTENGIWYFGSEAKALFAAGMTSQWNREYHRHLFATGAYLPSQTAFQGVRQVPPGHYLKWNKGRVQLVSYWDFDYPELGSESKASEKEMVEGFHDRLEEAVRLRMRADVPVGSYLSGGLDSCAVLALAARHSPYPVRAFTLAFDRPDYDESAIAQEMGGKAGADVVPVPIRADDLADHFSDAIWHSETACANGHGIAKFLLSRAVHEVGYKVVFTGEGSDEILAGYPHFRRDMLLYGAEGQDPKEVQEALKTLSLQNIVSSGLLLPEGKSISTRDVANILGFVPSWMETNASLASKITSLLREEFKSEVSEGRPSLDFLQSFDIPGQLKNRAPVHQSLYLWSKSHLPNYILSLLGDRMEMAHSVEGRLPFLDHKVVEYVRQLPVSVKIRGMTEKYLLREAVRNLVPQSVYQRQKHPFLSPPLVLDESSRFYELLNDTLHSKDMEANPFFDARRVRDRVTELLALEPGKRIPWDPVLMIVMSSYFLEKRFKL